MMRGMKIINQYDIMEGRERSDNMTRYQTPEQMYKRRKIKNIVTCAILVIVSIALIIGLQLIIYNL